ncbi:sugar kinase [Streptomyces sp. NPDC046821]|uniref:sugar kinase n=1 Tax=Streptomyces sp. NPDC046821 TaxID=3154702 RepID=UPI0033EA9751
MTVPRQPSSPDAGQRHPESRRSVIRRRALTLLTIVLLIGVPAGYLVISANQSRNSGKDKEAKYSATGLTIDWPSRVQRRLYQVPIPLSSAQGVAYYETNNIHTSRLYVRFSVSNAGLDTFLKEMGTSSSKLVKDDITISGRDQKVVGWKFGGPGPYSGLTYKQKDPLPTLDVVVNRSNPARPFVYVVSTTTP